MFDESWILSARWGRTSYERSIEHPFERSSEQCRPQRRCLALFLSDLATRTAVDEAASPARTTGHSRRSHLMSTITVSATLPRRPRSAAVASRQQQLAQQLAPQPAPRPARLTRRGRLAVTLALVAASTGVLGLAQPEAFALGRGDGPATQRITVRPGETLWAIADRVAPDADPRSTIAKLESMNHLESSAVPAGSVLLVPVAR
jgi:LysM domain